MGVLYNLLVICLKLAAFPALIFLVALVLKIMEYIRLAYRILYKRDQVTDNNILLADDHDSDEYIGDDDNTTTTNNDLLLDKKEV